VGVSGLLLLEESKSLIIPLKLNSYVKICATSYSNSNFLFIFASDTGFSGIKRIFGGNGRRANHIPHYLVFRAIPRFSCRGLSMVSGQPVSHVFDTSRLYAGRWCAEPHGLPPIVSQNLLVIPHNTPSMFPHNCYRPRYTLYAPPVEILSGGILFHHLFPAH